MAARGARHPGIREVALGLTYGAPDGVEQIDAIRAYLEDRVEFTRDPKGQELLYTPDRMVKLLTDPERDGILRVDCDDVAVLGAALGMSVGLQARFQVVGFLSPKAPFSHVWTDLKPPSGPGAYQWSDLDTTRPQQALPGAIRRRWIVNL